MRLLRYATGNSQFREPILIYVEGYNMSTSLFLAVLSIHFVFLNASSQEVQLVSHNSENQY